ncbi:alpha-1,2-mannosidase, putative [Bryocella elongata]|uniref:Alpha-1,2-mannosidase, putative n=1 Tax=Bryocella elongata TaxID=863522 RepID=A0A1H5SNJ9_9BACT|nr:GH92 family glycosyl hydrolase [Bryocella elongata]SEF52105.1 alpha-1,2-mannosidase, putative [Bryocella elongata]
MRNSMWTGLRAGCAAGLLGLFVAGAAEVRAQGSGGPLRDPAALVNPIIGTTNGGNDYPGATVPLGMVAWSPEEPRHRPRARVEGVPGSRIDDPGRPAAPGGYEYSSDRISGFSLTHLMGTGCAGASGDIPFMPYVGEVTSSPADDLRAEVYGSTFSHEDETAKAGYYKVKLANGVAVELTASPRTGAGRFTYPAGKAAVMLVRTSNSETGSSEAQVKIDAATRTISGSVTSGNFCGYIGTADRHSYYTLYFVAQFDTPFTATGTWQDAAVKAGSTEAHGGTTYGPKGFIPPGKGSGAWVAFDASGGKTVGIRVGVSYVSERSAKENLRAESPAGTTFDMVREKAHAAWNQALGKIEIEGGTPDEQVVFYTALYHTLMGENLYSDSDGRYLGMDGKVHTVVAPQKAQYGTFSGWDVYRSQLQLLTLIEPQIAGDLAQSLLNQATQNGGEWDRWTHNAGITHVMNGDPAAPAIADILAFGGSNFDAKAAYRSLLQAATVPTAHDLSEEGCPVECVGQRPSLDQWMKLHYIPVGAHAWGPAADTLEDVAADFAMSELARRMGDGAMQRSFLERAQYWKNIFNPQATPEGGYIQNRNADGTWPKFDPKSTEGFVEGSGAQYLWMVPFNAKGLFNMMGGDAKASERLNAFFYNADGSLAVTNSGPLHAELNNEPSIASPWLFDFLRQPWKTQEAVRKVLNSIWTNKPNGLPGNDDLGEMSSWYVWAAMGMYPEIPGRAELVLGSPLFESITIRRGAGDIVVKAHGAGTNAPYVQSLKVDGKAASSTWLPQSFVQRGGRLEFELGTAPETHWGTGASDVPPSFEP